MEQMLRFVTGITWEPMFGYAITPSIQFVEVVSKAEMLPKSSTCAHILYLPYCMAGGFDERFLFERFDMAFMNTYFGLS